MWSGSNTDWVDLHPPAYKLSSASGIAGDVQVGHGEPFGALTPTRHAILWRNTAESAVVLHPHGWESSEAFATDGIQHVGYVDSLATQARAALWTATSARFVNLSPPGYHLSAAYGVGGGQQVGLASFEGNGHAALWFGTRDSFVDLNPVGADYRWGSTAYATNGYVQVGKAGSALPTPVHVHAAAWRGSRETYMNLHQFLPNEYQGFQFGNYAYSEARGIDAEGVIVGFANHLPTNTAHAVLWRPIRR